jgi:predicted CopG family antitoxin
MMSMKTVKLKDEVYVELLKFKSELTIQRGRSCSFSEAIRLLLDKRTEVKR